MLVGLSPRVCVLHLAILVPRLGRGCDGMIESLRVLKVCRKSAISARRVTLQLINAIVDDLAPDLINKNAVGYQSASQLLITAGDNPERLKSEARRGNDDVELATLSWVDWFNNRRLLEPIGDIPPAEYELLYYQQTESTQAV